MHAGGSAAGQGSKTFALLSRRGNRARRTNPCRMTGFSELPPGINQTRPPQNVSHTTNCRSKELVPKNSFAAVAQLCPSTAIATHNGLLERVSTIDCCPNPYVLIPCNCVYQWTLFPTADYYYCTRARGGQNAPSSTARKFRN